MEKNSLCKNFLIVFDFEGVLFDSSAEIFYISGEAYKELGYQLKTDEQKAREKFIRAQHLVFKTGDFFLVLWFIHERPEINLEEIPKEEFFLYREKFPAETKEFIPLFYKNRLRLRQNNLEQWVSWHKQVEEVFPLLGQCKREFLDTAISSTKDKDSIEELLRYFKAPQCQVLGREFSLNKADHIKEFCRFYKLAEEKVVFIDDNIEKAKSVKMGTKAVVCLALWGANSEDDQKEAQDLGIHMLNKENLVPNICEIAKQKN